jgi:predicted DCC family thiol-disulfide oxidoreductase YuxK
MNSLDAKSLATDGPIVLFDGVCGLCEASVQFIIDHDPKARFRFAPLQSEVGRRLLTQHHLDASALDTLVMIEEGRAYVRSTAALRIGMQLGNGYALLAEVLVVIPEPLRDAVYSWIARNRYRWFGNRDSCRVPTFDVAARFLS